MNLLQKYSHLLDASEYTIDVPITQARIETPVTIIDPIAPIRTIWPPEVQSLIDWFTNMEPPLEPFNVPNLGKVIDPVKFFEQLRREIEIGPRGPRARMGTLQSDLRKLKAYLESESN